MEKILNKINILWGGFALLMTGVFGKYWFLFAAFLALNTIDYITGVIKARFCRAENSNKGWLGIAKKVGYWVVIAIAFFVSFSFTFMGSSIGADLGFLSLFGWLTLATFIINEIRSILENLVIIGVDVPKFLISGLEVAEKIVERETDGEI